MIKLIHSFLILLSIYASAQEDTTWYYGPNNKPAEPDHAVLMREVAHPGKKKIRVTTYTKNNDHWEIFSSQVFKSRGNDEFLVREYMGGRMERMFTRIYFENTNSTFKFREEWNGKVIRTGATSTRFPLTLEGEVVKYYDSGVKKSESEFRNGRLISNVNWLKNGDKYLSDVFYSVDELPEYKAGTRMLHKYLSEYIDQSGYNTSNLQGTVTIGFVVMATGEIDGVYVAGGITPEFDEVVAGAVKTIPGEWKPAVLDDNLVNCFLTIPINLRQESPIGFENLELSFSNNIWMLYW